MSWWDSDPVAGDSGSPAIAKSAHDTSWWSNDPPADPSAEKKLPDQDPRITALQEPGAAQRVLRGVPLLGGALDEIGAAGDAALDYVSGGRVGEPYETSLERRRQAVRKSDAEHPVRNTIEAVAGGAVAANALPYFRPFGNTNTGVLSEAANGGLNAVLMAAPTAFLEGEGGFENRIKNARDTLPAAATFGTVLGGAGQYLANRAAGTPANSYSRQAQNLGIELPAFMDGFTPTESIASKLGAIPFVGDDINGAVGRARTQTGRVAHAIGDTVSGGATAQEAGETARTAMTEWAGPRAREIQNRAYDAVNRATAGLQVPLSATQRAASELARQQTASASPLHARALGEIEQALGTPNGLTFEGISRLRTQIGTMMDNTIDPNNRTAAAGLQAIYGALTDDMETAIATRGGQAAQNAWRRANAINGRIAERRDTIARLVGAEGDKAGEGILDRIVSMASTKSSADAARLRQVRSVVGADGWREVSGNAVQRLGRNQSNEFSADIFLKNYRQLSNEGRRLLFESTGDDNLRPALDALAAVSSRLQRFSKLGNPSGTGGVTALLAALGGAASGDMFATLGTAVAGRSIGMLLARPAVVRNVTAYSLTMERFLRGQATRAALASSAATLARAVSEETGEDANKIAARINGNS